MTSANFARMKPSTITVHTVYGGRRYPLQPQTTPPELNKIAVTPASVFCDT